MVVSAQPSVERAQPRSPSVGVSAMSSLLAAVEAELAVTRPPQAALAGGIEESEPPLWSSRGLGSLSGSATSGSFWHGMLWNDLQIIWNSLVWNQSQSTYNICLVWLRRV